MVILSDIFGRRFLANIGADMFRGGENSEFSSKVIASKFLKAVKNAARVLATAGVSFESKYQSYNGRLSARLDANCSLLSADGGCWVYVFIDWPLHYEVLNRRTADLAGGDGDYFRSVSSLGCDF